MKRSSLWRVLPVACCGYLGAIALLAAEPNKVQSILAETDGRFKAGVVPGHVPASPDEELAKEFSLVKAAESLDLSALNWQSQPRQQCCQCHANGMYLIARPRLQKLLPEPPAVRTLFQDSIVAERWPKHGLLYAVESVVVAVPLAFHDRQTTGKLHPTTRQALDRMLAAQGKDGTWGDTQGGQYAFFRRTEQTLFAALGIGIAPDQYAEGEAARRALDLIRAHLKQTPPAHAFARGLQLWASNHVADLASSAERENTVAELWRRQRPDGGWALRELLADHEQAHFGKFAAELPSDGYGTGFAVFILREAGEPASDPRIAKAIAWLKSNQRESGRWFHPTLSRRPNHVLSNTATAWAVMALDACGEIAGP